MAVNTITITQSNVVGENNYLAIHSPLVFIAVADVTGTAPETLTIYIKTGSTILSTYSAILYANLGGGEYSYLFRAERAIRQQVPFPEDVEMSIGTIYDTSTYNQYRDLDIYFIDVPSTVYSSVSIRAYNAARQSWDLVSTMVNVYNNVTETIYAFYGRFVHLHYNKLSTGAKTVILGEGIGSKTTQTLYRAASRFYTLGRSMNHVFESAVNKDWFLPSGGALYQMWLNLYKRGIGAYDAGYYWTSSEGGAAIAYVGLFGAAWDLDSSNKTSFQMAIPVRTFVSTDFYEIGKMGQFGWVFYNSGTTYYEAAPVALVVSKDWGVNGVFLGATGLDVGDGVTNTATISAYQISVGETTQVVPTIKAIDNGYTVAKTFIVNVLPDCSEGVYVKYLDSRNGQYKYWVFNRYYIGSDSIENIGKVVSTITNISQSESISLGVNQSRKYTLVTDGLDQSMLDYLSPLFSSPRISAIINGVEVCATIDNGEKPIRWGKANSGSLSITFNLGQMNTLTML